jgi:hypothetical protein
MPTPPSEESGKEQPREACKPYADVTHQLVVSDGVVRHSQPPTARLQQHRNGRDSQDGSRVGSGEFEILLLGSVPQAPASKPAGENEIIPRSSFLRTILLTASRCSSAPISFAITV